MKSTLSFIMLFTVILITPLYGQARGADCQRMMEKYRGETCHRHDIKPVERCFEKMITKDPSDVQGYIGMAEVRYRQAKFDEALVQLDTARGKKTTAYDRCHIESLASSVYSHLGTSAARKVFQGAIKACHGVDADKEAVARMFLKSMKDGKPRPLLPM